MRRRNYGGKRRSFFSGITSCFGSRAPSVLGTARNADRPNPFQHRLRLEPLEDRRMLTVFLIDSLDDTIADDGVTTLREAIQAANTNTALWGGAVPAGSATETDVIRFAESLFTDGENPVPGTITLGGTELVVTDKLDIEGPGADLLSIDANQSSRVFWIAGGAKATLSGLTVTGGTVAGTGGGIYVSSSSLTVVNSTISGNAATGSSGTGGGIGTANSTDVLSVVGSTVAENMADVGGGGIYSTGVLNVTNSTISGNSATASSAVGGGVLNIGVANIVNSTISGNSAAGSTAVGGGVFNTGTANIINSTLSGNVAGQYGGGIHSSNSSSKLTLVNSTVTANSATGVGGGVYLGTSSNLPVLHNTVIAANIAANNYQVYGTVSSASSHNFIGYVAGLSGITNGVNGNQIGVETPIDPMLGPLQDNGGPTATHAPLSGSPLIDAGSDAKALDARGYPLLIDQRGFVRLYGTVDIGAVEAQPPGIPVAHDDGFVIEQDDMVTMDVLLNDFGNDGSPMTAVLLHSPTHGTLDENPDGTWTYTPEPGFWGVDTFSYQAANGELISNTAQVFVSVLSPTSIIVTTADDEYDGDLSPSDISLREALELAKAEPGSTIQFSAALLNQVILLTNPAGRLPVANVQIVGLGAPFLTIDGNQRDAVIVTGGESFLSHLTVTGGTNSGIIAYGGSLSLDYVVVHGNRSISYGGGIYLYNSSSKVFLDNSTVSGNSATQRGGGIYVNGGALTVVNSTISGNSAAQYGGGIYSLGSSAIASISNSTIAGNTAVSYAGGIFNSGVLTVTASTISHNSVAASSGFGGGIANGGTATVVNSTISGNSVTGTSSAAGGIFSSGSLSKLTLVNSTVTANSAAGQGGGVYVSSTPNPTVLHNTVVAGNTGAGQSQFQGTVSSVSSHNLIGYGVGLSGISDGVNGNQIGTDSPIDPMLGPLQDNGGTTATHEPLPGSPLIDAGSDAKALDAKNNPLPTDQRGFVRFFETVDIGAVESQPPGIPIAYDDGFVGDQDSPIVLDMVANDFCNDGSPMTA
ncbi:MAG TPA: hypothetical protein DD670_08375, partial [Planctomycetaceae bacterium]|nr:hypothetical protein [Planctomycetaceae bacterium]